MASMDTTIPTTSKLRDVDGRSGTHLATSTIDRTPKGMLT